MKILCLLEIVGIALSMSLLLIRCHHLVQLLLNIHWQIQRIMARALHTASLSMHLALRRVCLENLVDAYFEGALSVAHIHLIPRVYKPKEKKC